MAKPVLVEASAPPRPGPTLPALCAALAALPATEDPQVLVWAALADLGQLFGAAVAILRPAAGGHEHVWVARDLPPTMPAGWPAGTLGQGEAILHAADLASPAGAALQASGLHTIWRLALPLDEYPGAILLLYPDPAAAPPAPAFALAQIYAQQLGARLANAELHTRLHAQRTQLEAAEAVSEISAALNSH